MGEFDYDFGSDYDAYQAFDTPESYGGWSGDQGWGDMGGFGVQDWGDFMGGAGEGYGLDFSMPQQPQFEAPQMELPQYEMTNPGAQWTPPSMGEAAPPSIGQGGGSFGPRQEDDWMKTLGKAGLGMGVGVGTSLLGEGIKNMMAPKQKSAQAPAAQASPLPMAPTAPQQYTPQPLEALPGTQASPLLRPGPKQVQLSSGLEEEKKKPYGGFSLY